MASPWPSFRRAEGAPTFGCTDPINPAFNANSVQPSYAGQFSYTRVLNSTMVNQLLMSASYYSALFGPPNLQTALSAFPTTWTFTDGLYSSNSSGTSLGGTDNNYRQGRKVRQMQLIDDFSIVHGSYTFKFGGNVRKNYVSTYAYGVNISGLLTFNSMTDFYNGSLVNGSTYAQAFSRSAPSRSPCTAWASTARMSGSCVRVSPSPWRCGWTAIAISSARVVASIS